MITFQIAKTPRFAGRAIQLASALLLVSGPLFAATQPSENCEQIRARIGVAPLADPDLLRKLALRKDCQFTSRDIYQAAYGDRPLPPQEERAKFLKRYHLDDDRDDN